MATNTSPTSQNHNGTGSQANFAISFPFLLNTEIEVTVDGNPKTLGTHYNIVGSQVQFTSGNIPASGTSNVVLTRNTNISTKTVDFEDGSVLTETDLDNNANQLLFSMQEIIGSGASSVSSVTGTTPILSSGGTTPIISISAATTSAAGSMSASDKTKLDGIEASATADQTAAEIRTLVESASDSNVFTDADHTKLNNIEANATADQTNSEIKTAYEANSDTNAFTDAEKTKLSNVESNATADQTNAEIKTAYEANSDTNAFTDADHSKLDGIEASADVTDTTNVDAAGAVMNSDTTTAGMSFVVDEDNMASNSATKVPTQQSVKAYVDANAGGTDLTSGGTIDGDLTLTGANYNAVWDKSDNALEFADEAKAIFGSNLEIYSQASGNHSVINEIGSGSLIVQAEQLELRDTSANLYFAGQHDGFTALYHHGDMRLQTTANGINVRSGSSGNEADTGSITSGNIGVTGNITVSGTVDGRDVAADGTKLDGIEASADVTDATNVNAAGAVMNSDLDGKGELLVGDGSGDPTALAAGTNGYVLKANSSTATGLEWSAAGSGGDVNQNAFSNVAVSGQTTVAADSATDTLNIAAGSNVTITTNATSDTVTISSTDTNTTYSVGDGGLTQNNFTDALKTKLDGIEASADVTDATNVASAGAVMDGDFTSNGFMKRTGAGTYTVDTNTYLTSVPSGYLQNVSEDSSPQLAANLDVQTNEITTSTSNGNVKVTPNGTGVFEIKGAGGNDGTLQLNCSANSHGIKLKSPPHSAGASYTLTFPDTDGNANQVLKTDGSGGLDWVDQTGGGSSLTVQDEGSALSTAATTLNFVGSGVTASGTGATKTITISGGGGGGLSSDSDGNTLAGTEAGDSLTSGAIRNTLLGYRAGDTLTTQDNNVFIGYESGGAATQNVCIGSFAGSSITGTDNVAIGHVALSGGNSTEGNTAVGAYSLQAQTSGTRNTGLGYYASQKSTSQADGTHVGYMAGYKITTGTSNTSVGSQALYDCNTGSKNTCLGFKAGNSGTNDITSGSNNLILGYNAAASSATVDNEITLGDTNITKFRIPALNSFEINDSGQFSGVTSTASSTAGVRVIYASTASPSGGSDGDIWIKYTS